MSGSTRWLLTILLAVFAGYIALKIIFGLVSAAVHAVFSLIIPLAIVGGIALVLYNVINRKALSGGKRFLP